jgi:uracil-DNA glycosylase
MLEWEKGEEMQRPPEIGKLHGVAIKGQTGRVYFPVYHPAAALYGTSRKLLLDDFKKIPALLKK